MPQTHAMCEVTKSFTSLQWCFSFWHFQCTQSLSTICSKWKELLAVKSQGQKNLRLLRLLALCRFLNCSFPHFGQLHLKALPACDPVSEHMFAQKLLSKHLIQCIQGTVLRSCSPQLWLGVPLLSIRLCLGPELDQRRCRILTDRMSRPVKGFHKLGFIWRNFCSWSISRKSCVDLLVQTGCLCSGFLNVACECEILRWKAQCFMKSHLPLTIKHAFDILVYCTCPRQVKHLLLCKSDHTWPVVRSQNLWMLWVVVTGSHTVFWWHVPQKSAFQPKDVSGWNSQVVEHVLQIHVTYAQTLHELSDKWQSRVSRHQQISAKHRTTVRCDRRAGTLSLVASGKVVECLCCKNATTQKRENRSWARNSFHSLQRGTNDLPLQFRIKRVPSSCKLLDFLTLQCCHVCSWLSKWCMHGACMPLAPFLFPLYIAYGIWLYVWKWQLEGLSAGRCWKQTSIPDLDVASCKSLVPPDQCKRGSAPQCRVMGTWWHMLLRFTA